EFTGGFIAHCKCVIAQYIIAFAVPKLGSYDHHIQRRQFLLQLEPKHAAVTGQIEAVRVLDHQPFVRALPRLLEFLFDLRGGMCRYYPGNLKMRRQSHATEMSSPFMQRSL